MRKRNGIPQEFDRTKLQRSIEAAGIPSDIAASVAMQVEPREDLPTEEIRKTVSKYLGGVNPAYAASYTSTRKLQARGSSYVVRGICRLNEEFMERNGLKNGQDIMLACGNRRVDLRVESVPSLSSREILLNDMDLETLSASSGSRVGVTFTNE